MLSICAGNYNPMNREQLRKVPITPREFGKKIRSSIWKGIQHGALVDTIEKVMEKILGLKPVPDSEQYYVSPNGAVLVGGFTVGQDSGKGRNRKVKPMAIEGLPQETYYSVGFSHGNDSSRSLDVFGGGTVDYCTNGMVSCDDRWRHKHTTGLRLYDWIKEKLAKLWQKLKDSTRWNSIFLSSTMTSKRHERVMVEMARMGILPWRLMGEVDRTYLTARNEGTCLWLPEENRDKLSKKWGWKNSLWDYYNIVTHWIKKLPAALQLTSLRNAHVHLRHYCDPRLVDMDDEGKLIPGPGSPMAGYLT